MSNFGDVLGLKYSGWVHKTLLFILMGLYIALVLLIVVGSGSIAVGGLFAVTLALLFTAIFLLFWYLRTLRQLDGCFPWFHYVTLELELLAHVVAFIWSILAALFSFRHFTFSLLSVSLLLLIYAIEIVYVLLIYKLVAVFWTLGMGSNVDKEALDAETKGLEGPGNRSGRESVGGAQ